MENRGLVVMASRRKPRINKPAFVLVGSLFLVLVGLFGYKLTGHCPRLRSLASSIKNIPKAVMDSRSVTSNRQGKYTDIIFLHHSVGHNLVEEGGVREAFAAAGYNFWDHDYNDPGLTDPSGQFKGYSYYVPEDNTDIDGLASIFSQNVYPLPVNTLSGLLQHEIIIVKSCFPNSNIATDEGLSRDKVHYLSIRETIDKHPDKIFIIVTIPPLNPAETNLENAARARALTDWLKSREFLNGYPNLYIFDFFSYLAEDDPASPEFNMLRKESRDGSDSHPNRLANETISPIFVQFVIQSIQSYRSQLNFSAIE